MTCSSGTVALEDLEDLEALEDLEDLEDLDNAEETACVEEVGFVTGAVTGTGDTFGDMTEALVLVAVTTGLGPAGQPL